MQKLLRDPLLFNELFGCYGNNEGSGPTLPALTVINNGDGTADVTWTDITRPDGWGYYLVWYDDENNYLDYSGPLDKDDRSYSDIIINRHGLNTRFELQIVDDTDDVVESISVTTVITGDTAGYSYGSLIDGDGGVVTPGYPEEQWLFAELRANGLLSKIVDGFIRGHGNNTANRRKLFLGQGTFPAGTVTPSTGYITYSSNGYGSYVTNFNAMVSINAHGCLVDTVDFNTPNNSVLFGSQGTLGQHTELGRFDSSNWHIRLGNEGAATITVARGEFTAGMILITRTSDSDGAAYHFDGTTFSTIASSSGLSDGAISPLPMFTGCRNAVGTPTGFTNGKERLSLITTGLDAIEAENLMRIFWTYYLKKGWV